MRGELDKHLATCPYKPISCQYCQAKIPANKKQVMLSIANNVLPITFIIVYHLFSRQIYNISRMNVYIYLHRNMSTMIVLNTRYLVQLDVMRKYRERKYVNCNIFLVLIVNNFLVFFNSWENTLRNIVNNRRGCVVIQNMVVILRCVN